MRCVQVSSQLALGGGHVYTATWALTGSPEAGRSLTARVTSPHADWDSLEARVSHQGGARAFNSALYLSSPLLDALSASASLRYESPFDLSATAALDTPFQGVKDWKMEVGGSVLVMVALYTV